MRICAFVISILITVISTAQTPLIEELQLARKHFELKDYDMARIHFESLEVHHALSVDDVRRLALCYEGLGDNEEAIYRWHEVIKSDQRSSEDLKSLAILFKKEARYDESLEVFAEYRDAGGEDAQHHINSCLFAQQVVMAEANCDLENMAMNTSSAESGISFYNGEMVYATHRVDLNSRFGIKGDMDKRPKSVVMGIDENDPTNSNPLKIQDRKDDAFGFVSYAANGKLMVYVKSDFKADASGVQEAHDGMSLFYSVTNETGAWQEDKAFPFNSTEYDNGFPFVSEDGKTLFYSSDMPGGQGGFDLYVSHYENGSWSSPSNLGPQVNTQGNEITPYLTEDKLYFASDWLPGLGGYDVYSIKNVENTWGELAHLGACVNSPSDDFGFVVNPSRESAYFSSTRKGGKGHDDIYKIRDRTTISEIELVSTQSVAVPVIKTESHNIESQPMISESELKGQEINRIVISEAKDVARVENEIVKLRKLMHHKLDANTPEVRSRDLPDLNFDVDYISSQLDDKDLSQVDSKEAINLVELSNTEEIQIDEIPVKNSDVNEVALDGDLILSTDSEEEALTDYEEVEKVAAVKENVESPKLAIIEEVMYLPSRGDWTVKGITLDNHNTTLVKEEMTELNVVEIEDDFSSDYLIFDDPTITNLVLAPQEKVYFIQIAALKSYTSDLNRFAHFSRYGNVYKVRSGDMIKIRIGYFKSQREAVSVLEDLKKRGIREAFIVGDILDVERLDLIASPLDAEEGEIVNLSNDDLVPSYISKFKVRVSSYQWPSQFQTSHIADLGHIEHWTKGPWKIILLSGYSTRGQAFDVLNVCKKRGFTDAYVVKDNNGTLQRIDQ